ncbi:MAG: hypothetical protein ACI3XM_11455 [Eubacteriales bacterium]
MKRQSLSVWCLTLALLAANAALFSCGGSSDQPADGTKSVSTDATEAVTEDNLPKLQLPASDFGGQEFKLLTTVHAAYEYVAEEETGDIVEDAVYKRNRAVEELLNVNFTFIEEPGHWADKDSFNKLIKNSVMAGDGAYDLVSGTMVCVIPTAAEGIFMNVLDLPYIQLENPWWVQGLEDSLAIDGKLFGFVGDGSLSLYKDLSVLFFNKKLLADYDLPDPYQMVKDGTWTLDRMIEMSKAVSVDLNGDGKMKIEDDVFGFYSHDVPRRGFQTAMEVEIIGFDNDNHPYVAELKDADVTLISKFFDFTEMDNVTSIDMSDHKEFSTTFVQDKTLFFCEFLYATDYMRDMQSDFGIVPLPKRDEAQESYHTQIGTSTSLYFIPTTTNNPELTSMVCEAMCYYSYLDVIPTYYEVALKEKYTRDETVKEILNIIRSSATIDFTFAYSTMFTPFPNCLLSPPSETVASDIEKYRAKWEKVIDGLIEAYALIES